MVFAYLFKRTLTRTHFLSSRSSTGVLAFCSLPHPSLVVLELHGLRCAYI
jgi:hypothetical protein